MLLQAKPDGVLVVDYGSGHRARPENDSSFSGPISETMSKTGANAKLKAPVSGQTSHCGVATRFGKSINEIHILVLVILESPWC